MTAHSFEKNTQQSELCAIALATAGGYLQRIGYMQANCSKHGVFMAEGTRIKTRDIWGACPVCKEDAKLAEMEEVRIARAKREAIEHSIMLEKAAVPARFFNRTLDNFKAETPDQEHALSVAQKFAAEWNTMQRKGAWLVFSGPPGTGKSHLAIAILQAIMPGSRGRYMTCMELIQMLRGTWRKDSEMSEIDLLDRLTALPLIVLDEIGVQYGTESEQHHLFEVLDRRYRELRPTILLTNQDKDGFRQFVGDRVYDRMTEIARWVPFEWPSHRAKARKDFQ